MLLTAFRAHEDTHDDPQQESSYSLLPFAGSFALWLQ
jgi:hypothetical protein